MEATERAPVTPKLVGVDLDRALRLIELTGLKAALRVVPDKGRRGQVVDQSPAPVAEIAPGETVRLVVEEDNPIRFLPEVFHEEDLRGYDSLGRERPKHMLRSFLCIPQQMLGAVDRQMVHMDRQLSPEGASESFLPWLLGLVPMEIDFSWSTDRLRQVLRDAPRLLKLRGTAKGLEEMIELQTGVKVKVHETAWPHKGNLIGQARIGETVIVSTVPREDGAFYLELQNDEPVPRAQMERILRILDAEKPVHLKTTVVRKQTPPTPVVAGSQIGYNFVIGTSPVSGAVVTPPARIGVPGFLTAPEQPAEGSAQETTR